MSDRLFPRLDASRFEPRSGGAVSGDALRVAAKIQSALDRGGESVLRSLAADLDGLGDDESLIADPDELANAHSSLAADERLRLERIAGRIRRFAEAQRGCLVDLDLEIPGGRAGHRWLAVERAGCYAPGGRYPLPSSVLMTAIPAAVAGASEVWVASPRPQPITLAAAHVAGCRGVLRVGGAQAIFALAAGIGTGCASDVIVGPGNRYVTAAKQLVAGSVRIDFLAGPSELVVVAGSDSDPALVAADLLAQAEHDPEALPIVVSLDSNLHDSLEAALRLQLAKLPTTDVASAALGNGGFALVASEDEAVDLVNRIAPEHLEIRLPAATEFAGKVRNAGASFLGPKTSTVVGDYGVGPNHTLPTGGVARAEGGLSVLSFLKLSTWTRIDDLTEAREAYEDAAWLARREGLEGHARAADRRLETCDGEPSRSLRD